MGNKTTKSNISQAPPVVQTPKPSLSAPQAQNILLVGPTGTGKSTLINAAANLLRFQSYDELMISNNKLIVVGGGFAYHESLNDQLDQQIVNFKANVELSKGYKKKDENRNHIIQGDITQMSQSYLYKIGNDCVRFIDTPGVLDVRGVSADKKNFERLIQYISQYQSLEAVIVFVPNDTARLTASFRYSILELLLHLHKDATKNIIFVFTKTITDNYKPAPDAISTLRTLLETVKRDSVEIPLNRKNVFCFDSIWFREMVVTMNSFTPKEESDRMNTCFSKNKDELMRLMDTVKTLPPHKTMETVCLNSVRNTIFILHQPLANISKNILQNEKYLDKKVSETFGNNPGFTYEKIETTIVETEYPITVCTSCKEKREIGGKMHEKLKHCHSKCYLVGVSIEIIPNERLHHCACMDDSRNTCKQCGCSWNKHMHVRYYLEDNVKVVKIENSANGNPKLFIENMKKQDEKELQLIKKYTAEFCVYIRNHAISTTNDAYLDYLTYLQQNEKSKQGSPKVDEKFAELIRDYEQQTKLITTETKNKVPRTAEDINKMIDELLALPVAGPILRAVRDLELRRLQREGAENDDVIVQI